MQHALRATLCFAYIIRFQLFMNTQTDRTQMYAHTDALCHASSNECSIKKCRCYATPEIQRTLPCTNVRALCHATRFRTLCHAQDTGHCAMPKNAGHSTMPKSAEHYAMLTGSEHYAMLKHTHRMQTSTTAYTRCTFQMRTDTHRAHLPASEPLPSPWHRLLQLRGS